MRRRAIFMDRDGTICEEVGYVNHLSRSRLLPNSAEAIRLANRAGYLAIVVTNQSGVARGLFDEDLVQAVHRRSLQVAHREDRVVREDRKIDRVAEQAFGDFSRVVVAALTLGRHRRLPGLQQQPLFQIASCLGVAHACASYR